MRILLLAALFLFSLSSLPAQDIRNTWNGRFPVPGIEHEASAVAVEGDAVAVLTYNAVRIYRNDRWETPIHVPQGVRFGRALWPTRILALYKGEPWLVGDGTVHRYTDGEWELMPVPEGGFGANVDQDLFGPPELTLFNDSLYLLPKLHRWNGAGWERILPGCVTSVFDATVSESGRWFLVAADSIGCGVGSFAILDQGSLLPIDPPADFLHGTYPDAGIAFDGESPVTAGHRFENGSWQRLENPEWDEQSRQSLYDQRTIFPITGGTSLYALMPGSRTYVISNGGGTTFPCSNRLYRLEGDTWQPVSGPFVRAAFAVAGWGEDGVAVAGGFRMDGVNFVAGRVAGFDGETWHAFGSPNYSYTGVEGRVNDVELLGDSIWIGGEGMLSDGPVGPASLLQFYAGEWHAIPGINGAVEHLEMYAGDLYAAGDIEINGDQPSRLAQLRNGRWTDIAAVADSVTEIVADGAGLYVSTVNRADPESPRSTLYQIQREVVETMIQGWDGAMNTFAPTEWGFWIGGEKGRLARFADGEITEVPGPTGNRRIQWEDIRYSEEPASIESLLWHGGWLYVGGMFDSVPGYAVGNVARFDGEQWERLDSGVGTTTRYYPPGCGNEFPFDRVSTLREVDGEILAAGSFLRISTMAPKSTDPSSTRGEPVDVAIAIYNLSSRTWRPATPRDTVLLSRSHVRGVDVEDGRIAIAGSFTLPGEPPSRNVAVNDRVASVREPKLRTDQQLPFALVYEEWRLLLECETATELTIELYDISGRRLAELFAGRADVGRQEIILPETNRGSLVVVVRDRDGRSVGKIVPEN